MSNYERAHDDRMKQHAEIKRLRAERDEARSALAAVQKRRGEIDRRREAMAGLYQKERDELSALRDGIKGLADEWDTANADGKCRCSPYEGTCRCGTAKALRALLVPTTNPEGSETG